MFSFFLRNKILSVTKLVFANGSWSNCAWEVVAHKAKDDCCPLFKSCGYTVFRFLSVIFERTSTPECPLPWDSHLLKVMRDQDSKHFCKKCGQFISFLNPLSSLTVEQTDLPEAYIEISQNRQKPWTSVFSFSSQRPAYF